MLVIRNGQMDALGLGARASFVHTMAAHLRRIFPDQTRALDDAALAAFIERGIVRGAAAGVVRHRDVQRLIEARMQLGEGFEDQPRYAHGRAILDCADLNGTEKLDELVSWLVFGRP